MVRFLGCAWTLISKAMQARDLGEGTVTRRSPSGEEASDRDHSRTDDYRPMLGETSVPDFNRNELSAAPVSIAINALLEASVHATRDNPQLPRRQCGRSPVFAQGAIRLDV